MKYLGIEVLEQGDAMRTMNNGAGRSNFCSRRLRRGAAALEFALVLPLFALLLVGVIDLGTAWSITGVLSNAAREGARYGITHPLDTQTIQDRAIAEALNSGVKVYRDGESSVQVLKTAPGQPDLPFGDTDEPKAGDPIHVKVSYRHTPILGVFLGRLRIRIVRESTMSILADHQSDYGDDDEVEEFTGDPDFDTDPDEEEDELPSCDECDDDDPDAPNPDCAKGCIAD